MNIQRKNITTFLAGIAALLGMCLFSCGRTEERATDADVYFPVLPIVNQQVDSLKKSTELWKKTVEEDGSLEEKTLHANDLEWKTELALFYDLNPNKKAYLGKFQSDTAITNNGSTITYQSEDLKLALLIVVRDSQEVVKAIYGDLHTSNLFYTSDYKLSLVPYKAFAMECKQELNILGGSKNFNISWVKEK